MNRATIVLFTLFLLAAVVCGYYDATGSVIYLPPEYPVASVNFTYGGLFPLTSSSGVVDVPGWDRLLATYCTLETINNGTAPFPVRGKLNLFSLDSSEDLSTIQAASFELLKFNMIERFSNGTQVSLSPDTSFNIGTIISNLKLDNYLDIYGVFSDFPFPLLGIDFQGFGIAYALPGTIQPRIARRVPPSLVVSLSASFTFAKMIAEMMVYFNWTLITVLYNESGFGAEGQQFLSYWLAQFGILTVCDAIIVSSQLQNVTQQISTCLNENDSRVVIYWTEIRNNLTQVLQEKSSVGNLIFVVPAIESYFSAEVDTIDKQRQALTQYPSSFFFSFPDVSLDGRPIKQCLADIDPFEGIFAQIPQFAEYWEATFKCILPPTDLPLCPKVLDDRTEPCQCDGDENITDFTDIPVRTCLANLGMFFIIALVVWSNCRFGSYGLARKSNFSDSIRLCNFD